MQIWSHLVTEEILYRKLHFLYILLCFQTKVGAALITVNLTEHAKSSERCKMKLFAKVVNVFQPLQIFTKNFIVDV